MAPLRWAIAAALAVTMMASSCSSAGSADGMYDANESSAAPGQNNSATDESVGGDTPELVGTEGFVMPSTTTGHDHQIYVGFPVSYQEDGDTRYPVVYLNDGDDLFLSAVQQTRAYARTLDLEEVIVVAIGYPTGQNRRTLDYTPSEATLERTFTALTEDGDESGGAAQYHNFLVNELVPEINAQFNTAPDLNLLFGHSLGGLFALYEIQQPDSPFTSVIASSPSVWWEDGEVLNLDVPALTEPRSLYVSVGEFEQIPPEFLSLFPAEVIESDAAGRMIEGAIDAATVLSTDQITAYFHVEEAGTHINVGRTALGRGLRTLLNGTNRDELRRRSSAEPTVPWE